VIVKSDSRLQNTNLDPEKAKAHDHNHAQTTGNVRMEPSVACLFINAAGQYVGVNEPFGNDLISVTSLNTL
jgi:hypothetical protein